MSSTNSIFRAVLLTGGFAAQTIHAYNVVNIPLLMYKNIDPIVFPGSYEQSHLHSFFGSDAVTASTNSSDEIRTGCTNANNPNDISIYWVPTLLYESSDSYEPVPVSRFSAYYGLGDTPAEIPIPENLKMLAGKASAQTADAMPAEAGIEWFCEGDDASPLDTNGFPSKTCNTHLQTLLYFPNCVNTDTLETAYKAGRPGNYKACPTGMQAMPQLRFSIRYDLRKALPNGWSGTAPIKLASGNAYSSHGDFINGWTTDGAASLVEATKDKSHFVEVNGALGNTASTCKAADADPEHGTSNYAESVSLLGKRFVSAVGWSSRSRFARSI